MSNGTDFENTAGNISQIINSFIFPVFGLPKCQEFSYANHTYFQIANAFFLLSYLSSNSKYGVLCLRILLVIGCTFSAFWGYTVFCSLDALVWNSIFIFVNVIHTIFILCSLKSPRFTKEIEDVYNVLFKPLNVTSWQFQKILKCMKTIKSCKCQQAYVQEKVTKVDSLSLVLSGRFVISQEGRVLYFVLPYQFLDSPEWFGVSTDDCFQVSITALEDSKILLWHRDILRFNLMSDTFMETIFDHIIGRDVVRKLIKVNESNCSLLNGYIGDTSNHHVLDICGSNGSNKSVMIVKQINDGPGISALINRQLQVSDAKRLGKIEEVDHETQV